MQTMKTNITPSLITVTLKERNNIILTIQNKTKDKQALYMLPDEDIQLYNTLEKI